MIKRSKESKSPQMFSKYSRILPIQESWVIGDETSIPYFAPVRKQSNKIWATAKDLLFQKCTLSAKKVMHDIFFLIKCIAIQVTVKRGKRVIWKYCRDVVLKNWKSNTKNNIRSQHSWKHVRFLQDNAPSSTSAKVCNFLKQEKANVLPHLP